MDIFHVDFWPDMGNLTGIRIKHDNTGEELGWFLEYVEIQNKDTLNLWRFDVNQWLNKNINNCEVYVPLVVPSQPFRFWKQ